MVLEHHDLLYTRPLASCREFHHRLSGRPPIDHRLWANGECPDAFTDDWDYCLLRVPFDRHPHDKPMTTKLRSIPNSLKQLPKDCCCMSFPQLPTKGEFIKLETDEGGVWEVAYVQWEAPEMKATVEGGYQAVPVIYLTYRSQMCQQKLPPIQRPGL